MLLNLFLYRDSKANVGEFHRIVHRDGLAPAVLQAGVVRQTLHAAGHQNLGADTGLGHFKDLGKGKTMVKKRRVNAGVFFFG